MPHAPMRLTQVRESWLAPSSMPEGCRAALNFGDLSRPAILISASSPFTELRRSRGSLAVFVGVFAARFPPSWPRQMYDWPRFWLARRSGYRAGYVRQSAGSPFPLHRGARRCLQLPPKYPGCPTPNAPRYAWRANPRGSNPSHRRP